MHDEWARFAEIQYLARTARWWIPQLAQGDIALRVAGVDVRAVRRETIDDPLDDGTDRMVDDERQVDELVVDGLVTPGCPPSPRALRGLCRSRFLARDCLSK